MILLKPSLSFAGPREYRWQGLEVPVMMGKRRGTAQIATASPRNQDPHGPSIVWLSGDSDLGSHESRRVRTCSVVGINGAAVLVKSKWRGLRDATMRA